MAKYNLAAIFDLLREGYPADQLEVFAFLYKPSLANDFTAGQTNTARIQAIIRYAASQGSDEIERLLKAIRDDNPGKYREFEERLLLTGQDGAPLPANIDLPKTPAVPQFTGRQAELAAYRSRLTAQKVVIISGLPGMGKTWMGAKLAREAAAEENIFWFSFNHSVNNTSEALLRALAAFLHTHGEEGPWRYVNQELETQRSLEITFQLNAIIQALQRNAYIICLDEFELVKNDPGILFFFNFLRRHAESAGGQLPAKFILMGSEIPPEMEYLAPNALLGFNYEDAKAFLVGRGLDLTESIMQRLWEITEGSPMLLDLSVSALKELGGSTPGDFEDLLEHMAEVGDVRDYLMNNILTRLLPEEEEVLEGFSIFPAQVKRQTAVEILSAAGLRDVREKMYSLVRRGFISEGQGSVLRLHGLVRDYCYKLAEPDAQQRYHQAAATYYEAQQENLLAGYHHLERGAASEALDLFTRNVRRIVHAGDGSVLLKQLSRFRWPRLSAEQKAILCQARGDVYRTHGKYQQALDEYKIARDYARSEQGQARVLYGMGLAHSMAGDYSAAIKDFRQSLRLIAAAEDPLYEANIHVAMAWAFYRHGQRSAARREFKLSREAGLDLGDDILVARAGLGLGLLAWAKGSLDEAQDYFERSRAIFADFHDRIGEVGALNNIGMVYSKRGDLAGELEQYQMAMQIAEQIGDVQTMRVLYNNMGNLYLMMDNYAQAAHYYQLLVQLAKDTWHKPLLSTAYAGLADAHLGMEQLDEAAKNGEEALRVAQEIDAAVDLAVSYRVLGDIWLARNEPEQAKRSFEKCIPMLTAAEEDEELEKANRGLALALEQLAYNQPAHDEKNRLSR